MKIKVFECPICKQTNEFLVKNKEIPICEKDFSQMVQIIGWNGAIGEGDEIKKSFNNFVEERTS